MLTDQQARAIALSFPGAEEAQHHGHPDFRVANKIFATLRPDERASVLKLSPQEQSDLVRSGSRAYSLNAWSKHGWTTVHLEHISAREYRALAEAAWRLVAPKKTCGGIRCRDLTDPRPVAGSSRHYRRRPPRA